MAKKENQQPNPKVAKAGKEYVATVECYILGVHQKGDRVPYAIGDAIHPELVEEIDIEADPVAQAVSSPWPVLIERLGVGVEETVSLVKCLQELATENKCSPDDAVDAALGSIGEFEAAYKAFVKTPAS